MTNPCHGVTDILISHRPTNSAFEFVTGELLSDKTLPFLDMASAGQAELGAPVKLTAAPGSGPHTFALSWEKPGNSDAISYYFRV